MIGCPATFGIGEGSLEIHGLRKAAKTPFRREAQTRFFLYMRMLLLDKATQRYYAGPGHWVADAAVAFSFETTKGAALIYEQENIKDAIIVPAETPPPTEPTDNEAEAVNLDVRFP